MLRVDVGVLVVVVEGEKRLEVKYKWSVSEALGRRQSTL